MFLIPWQIKLPYVTVVSMEVYLLSKMDLLTAQEPACRLWVTHRYQSAPPAGDAGHDAGYRPHGQPALSSASSY